MNSNVRLKTRIRLVPTNDSGCVGCHFDSLPVVFGICRGRASTCKQHDNRRMIFKEVKPNGN